MKLFGTQKGQRARSGFTMAEVLTVIAIIAILAAIAVPSVLSITNQLRWMELDSAARSIFVASQNRMSELSASGEISNLGGSGITTKPSDFPSDELDWSEDDYYILTAGESDLLLPAGSLESSLRDGTFYIEYNARTGMVYGVFYSDEPFAYSSGLPRDEDGRKDSNPMLGYYGGSGVNWSTLQVLKTPEFEIINADTLSIRVYTDFASDVQHTVVVTDEEGNRVTYDLASLSEYPNIQGSADGTYTILLDSLESNQQFQTLLPELVPGSNLTVAVTAYRTGAYPSSSTQTTNSLFASNSNGTVTVLNARHLQNLDSSISAVSDTVTKAIQGNDLTWDDTRDFRSISNENLVEYQGGGNKVAALNAPLFAALSNATIQSVHLVDPIISVNNSNYVGTLANEAQNTAFVDCTVYRSEKENCALTSSGANYTGGLIGAAVDCTIEQCSASLPAITASNGNIGGLIGWAKNSSVQSCYANTGYWHAANEAWSADHGIYATNGAAGGFISATEGSSISSSYTTGNIRYAGDLASGFVGTSASTSFAQCYSATTMVGMENSSNTYGFLPAGTPAGCYFLMQSVPGTTDAQALGYEDLASCMDNIEGWVSATAETTSPYGHGSDKAYTFPRLSGMIHYGDWPIELLSPIPDSGFYYYELYSDGTYGYYGDGMDTLRSDLPVTEDGYVFMVKSTNNGAVKIECRVAPYTSVTVSQNYNHPTTIVYDGVTYKACYLRPNETILSNAAIRNSTQPVQITLTDKDSFTYYFNPNFAKEAFSSPTQPSQHILRTARHLARLGQMSSYWSQTFYQERDIDFTTYTSTTQTLSRIGTGTGSSSFSGTYDGGCNIITGAGISVNSDYVGLFGHNSGTLRNIVFKSDATITRSISSQNHDYIGALVGYNSRTGNISNCSTSGFNVSGSSSSVLFYNKIGGFVGYNEGTITNCSAANAQMNNSLGGSVNGTNYTNTGGFAGRNDGTISYCYAVATLSSPGNRTAGFVGFTQGGSINYSYCVAMMGSNYVTDFRGGSLGGSLNGCTAYNGSNLSAIQNNCSSARGFEAAELSYSYGTTGTYPFPAIVKNADGRYVHYGNW